MKVQENLISKQNTLANENKKINVKLHNTDMKIDQLNKENHLLQSRLSIAENTSTLLAYTNINIQNHHKHTEEIMDLERDLHIMEQ